VIAAAGPIASWLLAGACLVFAWGLDIGRLAADTAALISGADAQLQSIVLYDGTIGFVEMGRRPLIYDAEAPRILAAALGAYSLVCAIASSWPASLGGGWRNDASEVAELLRTRRAALLPRAAPSLARALWSYGVPASVFEPWMTEALAKAQGSEARQGQFGTFLDAWLNGDAGALRNAAEALAAAHPQTPEALAAQGLVASWLDGDMARADDCLSTIPHLCDRDVLSVRNLALAMMFRREGDIEATERTLDAVPQARPAWRTLAQRAMTGPLKMRSA
jgi:hypothetical protein